MAGGIGGLPSSGPRGRPTRRVPSPRRCRGGRTVPTRTCRGRAIRELPATERPRERLALRGAAGLTAAELIALRLGIGHARALGRRPGRGRPRPPRRPGRASPGRRELELAGLAGIGEARAAQLVAAFELGRRLAGGLADRPLVDPRSA